MKISIQNFKSIGAISDYEIKPLTILSGTNSSGKSSFIQLLLLLKQTVDIDSPKWPIFTEGGYYFVKNFIDVIKGKKKDNHLKIGFNIQKSEVEKFGNRIAASIFDGFPDYTCRLNLEYAIVQDIVFIQEFELRYLYDDTDNFIKISQDKPRNGNIVVETNNEYFFKGIYDEIPPRFLNVLFSSIFPNAIELIRYEKIDAPDEKNPIINERSYNAYTDFNSIKSYLQSFFSAMRYIGPLRVEPQDSYPNLRITDIVGIKGENVAEVLERRKNDKIKLFLPEPSGEKLSYSLQELTLLEATNFWICEVFKFGKRIYAKEAGESYSIFLVNHNDVESTIKHVGFGVSQILPVIVQGLLLDVGGTLILEQPEIHLHPKIQSALFDFLHSLILMGKNLIVETHSDHFITRMRRRIAEDETNELKKQINLTFIETGKKDIVFRTLNLDEYGALTYFPDEFIDRPDIELKAIINAQMKKRISKTDRNE